MALKGPASELYFVRSKIPRAARRNYDTRRQLLANDAMAASRVTQLRQNRQNQLLFEVPL